MTGSASAEEQVGGWAAGDVVKVAAADVNLRAGASTKAKVVRQLKGGETIAILEAGPFDAVGKWGRHRWYRVEVRDKRKTTGWIFGAFLAAAEGCGL